MQHVGRATAADRSSVLLISPTNQILLLHRVQTSSVFPSAHVFPGGNISTQQDGPVPGLEDPRRHADGAAYRLAAIRECFEESGILLAKETGRSGLLVNVDGREIERARHAVHQGALDFRTWVGSLGGFPDTGTNAPACACARGED
jgi:8-oxo-dGTP pyrophosphatase MutT (NUDIX family)